MLDPLIGKPIVNPQVHVVTDETVVRADVDRSSMPARWVSRSLYPGDVGCRNWLAVVHEPGYPLRDPNKYGLRRMRLASLARLAVETVVSLGPGDGTADVDMVTAVKQNLRSMNGRGNETRLTYIPVEICRPLLEMAIAALQPHAHVPAGILCDFEEGLVFLASALDRYATRPILFSLLGGTVGNLDAGEEGFFAGFRAMMEPGDAFLLDVPLAGPGWTPCDEPRLKAESYSQAFRQFLGNSLSGSHAKAGAEPPDATPSSVNSFGERVEFSLEHDRPTGAEVITVVDRGRGRNLVTFRRYRWRPLLRWFEDCGFAVVFAESSVISDQDAFGMGVVVLTVR